MFDTKTSTGTRQEPMHPLHPWQAYFWDSVFIVSKRTQEPDKNLCIHSIRGRRIFKTVCSLSVDHPDPSYYNFCQFIRNKNYNHILSNNAYIISTLLCYLHFAMLKS